MEDAIRQRLLKLTEPLFATDDWPSVENLWRPYVDQGDLDAQAYLAHMCLWCFDETEEKDQEMRGLLRASANAGHADAMHWLASHGMSDGTERDELLKNAAELGSRGASGISARCTQPAIGHGRRIQQRRSTGTAWRRSEVITTPNTIWDSCTFWVKASRRT